MKITIITVKITIIILVGFYAASCSWQQDVLERIRESGELRVIVRDSLATCYRWEMGFMGFEYTLAERFADELGVRLKIVLVESDKQAIDAIRRGKGHLVAGLKVIPRYGTSVRFGPNYRRVRQQVIHWRGGNRPKDDRALAGMVVEAPRGCECMDALREIDAKDPSFVWREHPSADAEELLSLFLQRKIDATIADSHEVILTRQLYPDMGIAFDIGEPQSLAWGFPLHTDDSLYGEARLFFEKTMGKNGDMDDIMYRYYGHMERFSYNESRQFLRHVKRRLPKYIKDFKIAAIRHGVDWHLLGAIGYQESHWNPRAVSPTGVRGIMMLTIDTANQLGVKNRTNEKQSIFGGARYFAYLKENKIAKRIREPDRTWFALASYNVGFGHLEDARILTQRADANPDRWEDVREFLPLISQRKWYERTRYGYARGHEPVQYVRNIRRYYDRLIWLERINRKGNSDLYPQ